MSVYVIAPDDPPVTQGLLGKNGIIVDAVLQASLESLGSPGTPELFIVNKNGIITQRLIGQQDEQGQKSFLSEAEAASVIN